MKRMIILVLFLFVFGTVGVMARQMESAIQVNVTTGPIDGNAYGTGAGYTFSLLVSSQNSRVLIKELDISNDAGDNTAQTITLYDNFANNASSANVTAIWTVTIGSGTTDGNNWIYSKTFEDGDRGYLKADNGLGVIKSAVGGTVRISIQYK